MFKTRLAATLYLRFNWIPRQITIYSLHASTWIHTNASLNLANNYTLPLCLFVYKIHSESWLSLAKSTYCLNPCISKITDVQQLINNKWRNNKIMSFKEAEKIGCWWEDRHTYTYFWVGSLACHPGWYTMADLGHCNPPQPRWCPGGPSPSQTPEKWARCKRHSAGLRVFLVFHLLAGLELPTQPSASHTLSKATTPWF